ncbi:hypothetical protein G4H71_13905 [Rhodococcus triatomae]|uniref:DUF4175 domain-containing protein n=1 Tax=Rhodococcus triatomae TaxID=300028 RepID=A0A1G8PIM3_9NOCA|nr:hypothetical protein [Rhodococcus triatomae]QNG20110.1 hypothetical protein G4H72_16470 [Rhodococcus triatomae]QNG23974.1 hypothetical protein G4H71_13905 [Rhodococcus triatomae]SDI92105.1 hypothetical protein SAMN05444695_11338 [Rhodococcus triatomae]
MNHRRIARTVAAITAGYVIVLALWSSWLLPHSPPGTTPYQVIGLLAGYGSALGIGMMLSGRPSRADRRLERRGIEGWARIARATPLRRTVDGGELTELDLDLTVPGSASYSGRIVYEVRREDRARFVSGQVVTVLVDPGDRDRIMLCP